MTDQPATTPTPADSPAILPGQGPGTAAEGSAAAGTPVDGAAPAGVAPAVDAGAGQGAAVAPADALPVDGAGLDPLAAGDALPPELTPWAQLIELLNNGGPIMYVLAGLSVITLAVLLFKLMQFTALRLWSRRSVVRALELWRGGRGSEAIKVLARDRSPAGAVLLTALRNRLDPQVGTAEAREEAERVAALYIDRLTGGLRLLAVIATLSPLLGLLGTVIGMIDAFQSLESAGTKVDPSILSGGIWVALLTTAAGLVVAIPAAAAHQWLEGIVERAGRAMEDAATQVFTHHPATALRRQDPATRAAE